MFTKQTIHISFYQQNIDEKTIEVLMRGDRYKLFKFEFEIDSSYQTKLETFYEILRKMSDIETTLINLKSGNLDVIKTLMQMPKFKTKQDLFKVLRYYLFNDNEKSESQEYLTTIYTPINNKRKWLVNYVGSIKITKLEKNLNIGFMTE